MASGYNGVTLFFILSGFVLSWNYSSLLANPGPRELWSFFVARLARIYPLYLFALLFAAAPSIMTDTLPAGSWLHVFSLQAWNSDIRVAYALNGPGWSIGVEFFLYAGFPLLIWPLTRLRSRGAILTIAVAAFVASGLLAQWFVASGHGALPWDDPASAHRWLYRMPLTRLFDFALGICAALIAGRFYSRSWTSRLAQAFGGASIIALMAWPTLLFTTWSWDFAYQAPAVILFWGLAANRATGLSRLLASKPMVVLGEASFAFYLLHVPLLGRLEFVGVETWQGWAFITALQFCIIALLAVGAHVGLEKPAQRFLRRVLDRRRLVVPEVQTDGLGKHRLLV